MATYKPLNSAKLRHRVEIQHQVTTQDQTNGEMTTEWAKYGDRWAEYVASSVRDFIAAGANQSQVGGRFVFRADPGIVPTMRVIHRGQVFAILGVMPDPDSGLEYITTPVTQGVVFDGR